MKIVITALVAMLTVLGLAALNQPEPAPAVVISQTTGAGREPMALPENYREEFIHFATVDRSDAKTRKLYINLEAMNALRAGDPLPDRTILIIEAYQAALGSGGEALRDAAGRLIADELVPEIHMAERRSAWRIEDLAASSRVGDWNFGAFDFETGAANRSELSDCFSCHEGASSRDFVFSLPELRAYARTGEVQYRTCGLPERIPCR